MIAKIEFWGVRGESASGEFWINIDDYKLTKGAKNAIVSAIKGLEATDGITRNAFVKVFVSGRKYWFVFTSAGLKHL